MNTTLKIFSVNYLLILFSFSSIPHVSQAKGPPPPSIDFSANPIIIASGSSSLLTWTTKRARTVNIDQGIGSVSVKKGSIEVLPHSTTTYTFTATGSKGSSSTASVTVVVNQPNNAPVAFDDSSSTDEDVSVMIDIIINDTDEDGDTLSIESINKPINGEVSDNNDGTVIYTPDENFNGSDSFSYIVTDGKGGVDSGNVSITVNSVNDHPVALSQTIQVNIDTQTDITLSATDVDNDPLVFNIIDTPGNGNLSSDDGDSLITYTPDAGFIGQDIFSYTVDDQSGGTDTAQVVINISPEFQKTSLIKSKTSTLVTYPEGRKRIISVLLQSELEFCPV